MNPTLLAEFAHQNLAESLRLQVRSTLGASLLELDRALLVFGSTRFPAAPFNAVLRSKPEGCAASLLDFAEDAFAREQRGFSVYAREGADRDLAEACEARGYVPSGQLLLLAAQRVPEALESAASQPILRTNVEYELVCETSRVRCFAELAAEGFSRVGLPKRVALDAFSSPEALLEPEIRLVLVHADGGPTACALLLSSDSVAGIYWVGTRSNAERRGLATACVAEAKRRAFESGASAVVLQAAPGLEPFYARLGFARIETLQLYSRLAARPARSRHAEAADRALT